MTAIDDVYAMPHLTAILVSGLDAEKFLQSQLSSNVAALEPKGVQLSSWCAANGRVIGLGWLYRTAEGFCWIVAADTAEAVIVGFRISLPMILISAKLTRESNMKKNT